MNMGVLRRGSGDFLGVLNIQYWGTINVDDDMDKYSN
jgi:hypothetical protein